MSRYAEFEKKVGETEDHYCGKCKETRPHIWIMEKHNPYIIDPSFYNFYLKCKYCGTKDMIYTTE